MGWILTLRRFAVIFNLNFFNIWNLVMTIILCITWLILVYLTSLAFYKGKIFISSPEDILKESARRQEKALKEKHDLESALMANGKMVLAFAAINSAEGARESVNAHAQATGAQTARPHGDESHARDHVITCVEQV